MNAELYLQLRVYKKDIDPFIKRYIHIPTFVSVVLTMLKVKYNLSSNY